MRAAAIDKERKKQRGSCGRDAVELELLRRDAAAEIGFRKAATVDKRKGKMQQNCRE